MTPQNSNKKNSFPSFLEHHSQLGNLHHTQVNINKILLNLIKNLAKNSNSGSIYLSDKNLTNQWLVLQAEELAFTCSLNTLIPASPYMHDTSQNPKYMPSTLDNLKIQIKYTDFKQGRVNLNESELEFSYLDVVIDLIWLE